MEEGNCWPCFVGCNWRWNPTQGGSPCASIYYSDTGKEIGETPNLIHSRSNIYNFDWKDGRSGIFVTQDLRLAMSNAIQLDYYLENQGTHSPDGTQSVPAAFMQPVLGHPWAYRGASPWTGAAATELNIPPNGRVDLNPPDALEPWVAWIGNDGNGLALYAPSTYLHHYWTVHREIHEPNSTNTNAVQSWIDFDLNPQQTFQTRRYVIYGTLPTIRATVYELEQRSWFQDVS